MTAARTIPDEASDWRDLNFKVRQIDVLVNQGQIWQPVTYASNWRALGGDLPSYNVEVAALPGQQMTLRGIAERITSAFSFGDSTRNIGTLPEGYRPVRTQYRMAWLNDATDSRSPVRVVIASSGLIYTDQVVGASTGGSVSGAPGGYVVLDGLSFPAF